MKDESTKVAETPKSICCNADLQLHGTKTRPHVMTDGYSTMDVYCEWDMCCVKCGKSNLEMLKQREENMIRSNLLRK